MITAHEFLQALFAEATGTILVTSVSDLTIDENPEWGGRAYDGERTSFSASSNNYFVVSELMRAKRTANNFAALRVLMLDDVGTKVAPELIQLPPTYRIRTSPDNEQYGFALNEPLTSRAKAKRLLDGIKGLGLTDKGTADLTRYARLPVGVNNKPKYGTPPPAVGLVEWFPERKYSAEQLESAFGIGERPALPRMAPGDDTILALLIELGLCNSNAVPNVRGFIDITCPWASEHTTGNRTAGYMPGAVFKCFHEHHAERRIGDLLAYLTEHESELSRTVEDVVAAMPGQHGALLRALRIQQGQRHVLAEKSAAHLGKRNKVFQRSGMLVRPIRVADAGPQGDVKRDEDALIITPVSEPWLQTALTESPGFFIIDKDGLSRARDCPATLAKAVATLGEWGSVPVLRAVARAPFLRPDGSVCTQEGYDPDSKMYLQSTVLGVAVSDNPTRADAVLASQTLLAPFREFPFKRDRDLLDEEIESSKAAFAAAILTVITRHLLELVPAFSVSAPTPGTGKSLLAKCIARIHSGLDATVRGMPTDDEEMKKVLLGIALAGDPFVLFDNLKSGALIKSPELSGFITAGVYGGRVLGQTSSVSAPNVTTVVVTGNNIAPSGEMLRRTINIQLMPDVERPELRRFEIPHLAEYVREHRARLLSAALTWMTAFIKAGKPRQADVPDGLGSFEHWCHLIRDAVLWIGLPDPLVTVREATEDDEEHVGSQGLLEKIQCWQRSREGGRPFAIAELEMALALDPELRTVAVAAGMNLEAPGYWVRSNKNRWFDNRMLYQVTKGRHPTWGIASKT